MQKLIRGLDLRGALPKKSPAAMPPIYLGMSPLQITGVKYGMGSSDSSIKGISNGGIELVLTKEKPKNDLFSDKGGSRTSKTSNSGRTRNVRPSNAVRSKAVRNAKKGKKSKKAKAGIKVITRKNGTKAYIKNGKFIKKPKGG